MKASTDYANNEDGVTDVNITKLPSATPDALADRKASIQAALDHGGIASRIEDHPPDPASIPVPTPRPAKDALTLYGHLTDQHQIVLKRMRELVTRPAANRDEILKVLAAQLFRMMETIKEMQR